MRRTELQKLAKLRIADAIHLLAGLRFSGAYYLAGYGIELGLKACIARQFRAEEIPDKRYVDKIYCHQLSELVNYAGLGAKLKLSQDEDQRFQAYWGVVNEWSVDARYSVVEAISAQLLIRAIVDSDHGVFPWIQKHW